MRSSSDLSKQERFLGLLNPVWSELARYCNAIAQDHESARDLMSETLASAFQDLNRLRADEAFKRFLFTIARRTHHRSRRKSHHDSPFDPAMLDSLTIDGLEAERSLAAQELVEAMRQLPQKQSESIILFDISGLSLNEVRDIQGGSLSGVKTRIVRGRETLARLLEAPRSAKLTPAKKLKGKTFIGSLLTLPVKVKL